MDRMESFQVIQPRTLLSPYVKNYWFLRCGVSDVPQRIIPGGCISLVFHRLGRMFSEGNNDLQPSSFLCGQSCCCDALRRTGEVDMIHLTFRPSGARA
ncbi:MAG: AraC family transcriptional regulator, partial [Rikenellaceae bacterium]|nr:AraC family transcriptional regulator [Rikenellaceae bacterium]